MTTSQAEGACAMLKRYLQVSVFALKKVHEQFLKASDATLENLLQPCSGTFKLSMGLSCSHEIRELLNNDKNLQLDNFHQHWWIYQHQLSQQEPSETEDSLSQKMSNLFQESTIIIQDPEVQSTRGRLVGAKNHSQLSTKRDPSAFELIMSGNLEENSQHRKCGICRESGHNSRTCPNIESSSKDSS
ncbi:32032_t:CDS:2 [Gigaspora margarita]|uniref:32032_t:CDS:1 n=1 Tax=Gigaspora margarita TaxID=4874 RepID=A0ABN7W4N1_GIGMA|nr:32032_t:CDS:2 [Gigaspora margarita]